MAASSGELSKAERARLARLEKLGKEHRRAEAELYRSLRRAYDAGYSLRTLAAVTGVPRTTIDRRLKAGS